MARFVSRINPYARRALKATLLPLIRRVAHSHVVGPYLEDAIRVCRSLSQQDIATTIGYWGGEEESQQEVADAYLNSIQLLATERLDCYVSIKAALGFDPDLIARVLHQASELGVRVHFDSLGPEAADQTFSLIAAGLARGDSAGCTLPGRWRRSIFDADFAIEKQIDVRVVKGQWPDPTEPDVNAREGFLAVVDRLAGRAHRVAVATHDPGLAREALQRLRSASTPCGLELLYGLPSTPILQATRDLGISARVYVPYGHDYLPYALSQVWADPRILRYLVNDLLPRRKPYGAEG